MNLRIALDGCGSIGRRHLTNLRHLTAHGATEIFVHDIALEVRQAIRQEFDVIALDCPDALWETQPDIALICTPSHLHTAGALAAASAGAHLFIEKPVAHSLNGLDALACLTTEQDLTTLVGCNMRFHPGPAQIKRWLDAGIVGETLSARLHTGSYLPFWRPQQNYQTGYSASETHGGAILDCIHEIDLACWLLGPAALHSALVRPATSLGLATDGLAELLLTHSDGAISSIHLNFVQRNYERYIEVIGSEGTLRWDFKAGEAVHYGASGEIVQRETQPADWNLNQMYQEELAYFLRCVETAAPTFNPVANAAQTLGLALQARSAQGATL